MAAKPQPNHKCVEISLAQDYSAYGRIKVHIPEEEITQEKLEEIVEQVISTEKYEDEVVDFNLDVDYSTGESLRIVNVSIDGEMSPSFDGISLDENAYNLGYATQAFLKGNDGSSGMTKLLETAVNANLLRPMEMVTMTGALDFAHEIFTAEFQVRKGATQVEMDHAFMCALAQRAKINYTEEPELAVAP